MDEISTIQTGKEENDWFDFSVSHINSIEAFVSAVLREHKTATLFRGHKDAAWALLPAIYRSEFLEAGHHIQLHDQERLMMDDFKRMSRPYLANIPGDEWEWLALARHHQLPTRILDWTVNPLAALFFAVEEPFGQPSAVWCYGCIAPEDGALDPLVISPLDVKEIVRYDPPHIHSRISAQSSVFTVVPSNYREIENPWRTKLVQMKISPECRTQIRKELEERLAVHRATMFPDLDGIAQRILRMWSTKYFD